MDPLTVRAYAVRGLTSRLAELDTERSRILDLLSELGVAAGVAEPAASTPTATPQRRRTSRGASHGDAATRHTTPEPLPVAVEPEEARILPRRRARVAANAEPPVPVLPPMPRLVKARVG